MSKDNGGPAFPADELNQQTGSVHAQHFGMTLRDYFAAKAMPVHMTVLSTWDAGSPDAWQAEIARLSYGTADAMLEERNS